MTPAELQQQRVVVVGLGVSGASVARYLERSGVAFDAVDARDDHGLALPHGTQVFATVEAALGTPAGVIVLSPGIPRASASIVAALEAGVCVVGDIELFAAAVRSPVIAVTGSNGKSTVVAWLADALQRAGIRAVACGNIGIAALDALEQDSAELYVLELSSYQLESTTRLRPLVGCVLNISEDHLDRYTSLEHYAATKRHVYHGAQHAVANASDARTLPVRTLVAGDALVATTQPDRAATPAPVACWHLGARAANADAHPDAAWLCRDGEALLPVAALSLPGRHNALNALAVLALAQPAIDRLRGATAARTREGLLEALAAFAGLPHRTELVAEVDGVRWYDDSKGTNVDASCRAIEAMPGPVVLIAGGLGKGADFSPLAAYGSVLKLVVLIGRDAPRLRAALESVTDVVDAASLEAAVDAARAVAVSGDVVLLSPACASFDMFDSFQTRGRRFQSAVRGTPIAAGACQ